MIRKKFLLIFFSTLPLFGSSQKRYVCSDGEEIYMDSQYYMDIDEIHEEIANPKAHQVIFKSIQKITQKSSERGNNESTRPSGEENAHFGEGGRKSLPADFKQFSTHIKQNSMKMYKMVDTVVKQVNAVANQSIHKKQKKIKSLTTQLQQEKDQTTRLKQKNKIQTEKINALHLRNDTLEQLQNQTTDTMNHLKAENQSQSLTINTLTTREQQQTKEIQRLEEALSEKESRYSDQKNTMVRLQDGIQNLWRKTKRPKPPKKATSHVVTMKDLSGAVNSLLDEKHTLQKGIVFLVFVSLIAIALIPVTIVFVRREKATKRKMASLKAKKNLSIYFYPVFDPSTHCWDNQWLSKSLERPAGIQEVIFIKP